VPVVEAGLGRQPPVGVQAVEVEVEQLVDGQHTDELGRNAPLSTSPTASRRARPAAAVR